MRHRRAFEEWTKDVFAIVDQPAVGADLCWATHVNEVGGGYSGLVFFPNTVVVLGWI